MEVDRINYVINRPRVFSDGEIKTFIKSDVDRSDLWATRFARTNDPGFLQKVIEYQDITQ